MYTKCLLDVDGVLADIIPAICKVHDIENPFDKPENKGKWEMSDICPLSPKEMWDPIEEDFWATIPVTSDAQQIVDLLTEKFGESNICLLTSPTLDPRCASGKIKWIEKEFPQFKRQFLIGPNKAFCARSTHLLVDDAEHNVTAFKAAGGGAFLLPRYCNKHHADEDKAVQRLREHLNKCGVTPCTDKTTDAFGVSAKE
jgi:5'(3')-deoxyribonucleotidase